MDLDPETLQRDLVKGKIKIAIVGAGRIGLPTAVLFANAGAMVTACDIDPKVVEAIGRAESYEDEPGMEELISKVVQNGHLTATRETSKCVADSDVIIICVPTPVSDEKVPVYDHILRASREVGQGLKQGALVIVESTIAPGALETQILPVLEEASGMKAGKDFLVAACPERADPGSIITRFRTVARVVGGNSEKATELAMALYRPLADTIIAVPNPKTANAVKLTENIFRDVNIALMSELAILYERMGISVFDVIDAAASKWNFIPHYPGAGVGGPCLPANAYYIIVEGNKLGYVPYLVRLSREVNDRMPHEMVRLTMEAFNSAGKCLKDAKITILGLTYKPGVHDTQNSPAIHIITELDKLEAKVTLCDPLLANKDFLGHKVVGDIRKAIKGADCVLLVTSHQAFQDLSLKEMAKLTAVPLVLVDGRGLYRTTEKPDNAIYLGIGLPIHTG